MIVDPAQAAERCPASYPHEPDEFSHHRWTSDTSDGIVRCVKCAVRARAYHPETTLERPKST